LPYAQMVVDIGDGVTDIALIRSGEVAGTWAVRTGCGELRAAVGTAVSHGHGMHLWRGEAERLVGEVMTGAERVLATGQDSVTGRGRKGWVPADVITAAAEPILATIVGALKRAWGDLSPDVSCEVIESGVLLVGGGSLVRGLRERLARETALDVRSPDDPLHAVITGARVMLDAGIVR
jgi:rod shape-determining protein MreB